MTIQNAFTLKPSPLFKNAAILQVISKMHLHLHGMYHCGCCGTGKAELAADNNRFDKVNKAFDKAVEAIHTNGGFSAKDLNLKAVKNLTKETFNALKTAVDTGITQVVPPVMKAALENNVFFFSGLKSYVSLKEASALLLNSNGSIKPLYQFKQDILAINSKYNQNYLEAEHGFATRSAQMAAKWVQFQKDGDRYDLQYRTANDGKVRPAHRALHNITLPITDPFWLSYWAPLGWRCRCNIVQVLKGKYEVTDSATASALGEKATTIIGPNGENKAEIFRGNAGAQQKIFPENHPYAKLTPQAAVAIIETQAKDELKPQFTPSNFAEYEAKAGVTVNNEIFKYLNKDVKLVIAEDKGEGSYFDPSKSLVRLRITDDYRKSPWKAESVVYHEFGHAIDHQNGIRRMPEITDLMAKYRKVLKSNKNEGYNEKEKLWQLQYTSGDRQIKSQAICYADTLMSLNHKYGIGHSTAYFKKAGMSEAEFVAHLFENKFKGNEVFEKVHPELYKEGIEVLTKILENL